MFPGSIISLSQRIIVESETPDWLMDKCRRLQTIYFRCHQFGAGSEVLDSLLKLAHSLSKTLAIFCDPQVQGAVLSNYHSSLWRLLKLLKYLFFRVILLSDKYSITK